MVAVYLRARVFVFDVFVVLFALEGVVCSWVQGPW